MSSEEFPEFPSFDDAASFPVAAERREHSSTKTVVVFMPPPVDPGFAPMNMRTHMTRIPAFVKPDMG